MKTKFLAGAILMALMLSAWAANTPEKLSLFERGSWQKIVRAHAGRPTLVHFWGVTCGPCKVELPLLGAFMKGHPAIDIVTISADLVPNLPEPTLAMLQKSDLSTAENWIFNDGFVERLRYEIDPGWQGDIPRTLLIARDGQITTLEGTAEMADIEKWADQQSAAGR